MVQKLFPLFLHLPQLQSSRARRKLLIVVPAACESDRTLLSAATLHRAALCGWLCVNVWGGAHHRAGKAPRHHHSLAAAYITKPFSSSQDLLHLSVFPSSTAGFILHCFARLCRHSGADGCDQSSKRSDSYSVVFWDIALAHTQTKRGALLRGDAALQLKPTTSFCRRCKQKVEYGERACRCK